MFDPSTVKWKRSTEKYFSQQLNVVPPIMHTCERFLVGEPNQYRYCRVEGGLMPEFEAHYAIAGNYYVCAENLTRRELGRMSMALVLQNVVDETAELAHE